MRAYAHAAAAWFLFVLARPIYWLSWALHHLLTSGALKVLDAVEEAQAYHTHRVRELEGDLDDDAEEDCA